MASGIYNQAKLDFFKADMDLDSVLVAMLVDDSYEFDPEQEFVDDVAGPDDVSDHEIVATNYVPGPDYLNDSRTVLANVTNTLDDDEAVFDADNITWANLGPGGVNPIIGGVVIYLHISTVVDTTNRLFAFIELPTTVTNGEDFIIQWDSTGIVRMVQ